MALGGVATGSMKAKEALRVQGIITYRGFKLIDWDWVRTHTETQPSDQVPFCVRRPNVEPQKKKSDVKQQFDLF